jgi:adenylate cyclase
MPGVEVHANVLDDLLHNRYLIQLPFRLSWVIGFLFLSLVLALVLYTSLAVATGAVLAQLAAYLAVAQWAFTRHLQLPVVPVIFSWSLSVILGFAYQYWIEGAEKRKVSRIFSRYVSKDVYHQLLDNPSAAELGGKRALITVLFSDLRGFTSISEKLSPEAMIAQLNEYFSEMVKIVFQHQGTIDKFVGDMIMALFNAPLPDPEHADHAVQCGIAMNRKLDQMNEVWRQQGRPELHCGVGINSGDMAVGNVGAETIRSYTVIGDNVNLGSRLESQCKEYKAEIIISEFTRAQLKHDYPIQELGDVLVKGKSRPVKIFRVFYQPDAVSKPKLEKEAVTK